MYGVDGVHVPHADLESTGRPVVSARDLLLLSELNGVHAAQPQGLESGTWRPRETHTQRERQLCVARKHAQQCATFVTDELTFCAFVGCT